MVAVPGMNPGTFVAGGGGDGGGGSGGRGGARGGGRGGDGSSGREDASGGGKEAPDPDRYPVCGSKSHPVDVITGRAYTHPIEDFSLGGPLPLVFRRVCSSKVYQCDLGLGPSWAHTLGWRLKIDRRAVRVHTEKGTVLDMPIPEVGETVIGPWGWRLRRDNEREYALDADENGLWRHFRRLDGERPWCLLERIEDRNHNQIRLNYQQQQLTSVEDSAGRRLQVRTNSRGQIESISLADGGAVHELVTYRYDEGGRMVEAIDADGFVSRYGYDDRDRLTEDTDRTGLTFHFVYDIEGRCIESWGDYPGRRDPSLLDDVPEMLSDHMTRAKGVHHCVFEYWPDGGTQVSDSTTFGIYDGTPWGTVERWCEGGEVWDYSYDDDGFLIRQADPMQAVTSFERDKRGRLLAVTDPLGRTTRITRDEHGLPVHLVDPEGAETRVWRDLRGNIETVQDACGGVTQLRRNERGQVTEVVHANGAITHLTYDAQGNLVARRDPNGATWRYEHDALGRRTAVSDPLGADTRYRYSARGDLLEVRDGQGGVTRYTYDGEHHLMEIVDPGGRSTRFEWGGYHRLCARTDANGNTVRLGYNREGELVRVTNERGQVHGFDYDSVGRLIGERTFDGRELHYDLDLCGRPVRIRNRRGGQDVKHEYDLAGQLVRRTLFDGSVEEFTHDGRGALISASGATGQFHFDRDPLGRIVRETQTLSDELHHPDFGAQAFNVDVGYDAMGARSSRSTSLGHTEVIERDVMGRRTCTIFDGSVRLTHERDLLGREIARELPGGAVLESQFDVLGRLDARRVRTPGRALARVAGEPEWLGDPGTVTYDKQYQYDSSNELVAVWDKFKGPTRYEYDRVGQLLASIPSSDVRGRQAPPSGGSAAPGEVPPPGRQRQEAGPPAQTAGAPPVDPNFPIFSDPAESGEERFTYDAAGNLYDAAGREYDAGNQLVRRGPTEYLWNENGQLSEKRRTTSTGVEVSRYTWNGAGLLESVDLPDGRQVTFAYDPFARRIHKRLLSAATDQLPFGDQRALLTETRFFWDGQHLAHEVTRRLATLEPDGPRPILEPATQDPRVPPPEVRTYCHEDGSHTVLAGKLPDGTWAFYVNDIVGTPEALVGEDGEPLGTLERRAWRMKESKGLTPFRFPGQYEDEETGLCYNRYRYYDPDLGRFVSADPVGLLGGMNVFSYAPSAVGWRDPLGLTRECPTYEIYTAADGTQRIRFQADQAFTLQGATPGRNYSTDSLAGLTSDGQVYVHEGRHRAIGAAHGDVVSEDLGGMPGRPGWLDYEFTPGPAPSGGIPVKDLSIDYAEPDVSGAEADAIRRNRYGF